MSAPASRTDGLRHSAGGAKPPKGRPDCPLKVVRRVGRPSGRVQTICYHAVRVDLHLLGAINGTGRIRKVLRLPRRNQQSPHVRGVPVRPVGTQQYTVGAIKDIGGILYHPGAWGRVRHRIEARLRVGRVATICFRAELLLNESAGEVGPGGPSQLNGEVCPHLATAVPPCSRCVFPSRHRARLVA